MEAYARTSILTSLVWVCAIVLAGTASAQSFQIVHHGVPARSALVTSLAAGPDGNIWFTEISTGKVGRSSTTGFSTEVYSGPGNSRPLDITSGPDGNLWFTDFAYSAIVRISTSGAAVRYSLPTPDSEPTIILAGPDGALWFIESGPGKIGRIDTSGQVREYVVPGSQPELESITVGGDGALWFTDNGSNSIGRFDIPSATFSTFPIAATAGSYGLGGIARASDGALWFTQPNANSVTRLDVSGGMTSFAAPPGFNPFRIAPGPNGALFFTGSGATIGEITAAGSVTEIDAGISGSSALTALGSGPDGALWFANTDFQQASELGRLAPPMQIAVSGVPDGFLNVPYAATLSARYAAGQVTWSVSGALPAGLNVVPATGNIVGTPVVQGTFTFSVSATDSSSPQQTASMTFTMNIGMPPFMSLTTYQLPPDTMRGLLQSIAVGADGNVWMTEQPEGTADEHIERLTPAGDLTDFDTDVVSNAGAGEIVTGESGTVWFSIPGVSTVGEISESGAVSTHTLLGKTRYAMAASSDGSTWVSEAGGVEVIGPGASDRSIAVPVPTDASQALAPADDGAIWLGTSGSLWRLSQTRIAYFQLPINARPASVTAAPDGSIWFTDAGSAEMTRFNNTGQLVGFAVPSGNLAVSAATGADGSVWFTEQQAGVGLITSTGRVVEYPVVAAHAISTAPDGSVWFAQNIGNGQIGRLAPAPLLVASFVLPTAELGMPYGPVSLSAQGGAPPYGWRISSGSPLPPGLFLDSNTGTLTGIPRLPGTFAFDVEVSDQSLPYAQTVNQTVTIVVNPPLSLSSNSGLSSGDLVEAVAHTPYVASIPAAGGSAPYACSVTSGSLPIGMSLSGCLLTGTPAQSGTSNFAVTVVDAAGASATASYSLVAETPEPMVFDEFSLPRASSLLGGITSGADGVLWFTEGIGSIGRITTSGTISEFPVPGQVSPDWLAQASNGALWFTQDGTDQLGSITSAGIVSDTASGQGSTMGISAAEDGSVAFTAGNGTIGVISGSGDIQAFPVNLGKKSAELGQITQGPDGAFWFTDSSDAIIGRLLNGAIQTFPLGEGSSPFAITTGSDGALWFTEQTGAIGRITTFGAVTEYHVANPVSHPFAITPGADGALWFTESEGNNIGRITTSGVITEYPIPTAASTPYAITSGPDGAIWFTERNGDKIGRLSPPGQAIVPTPGTSPQPALPKLSLKGLPSDGKAIDQPLALSVALNAPSTKPINGTARLAFDADPPGLPPGYADPALQFVDASTGKGLGTSYNFSIAAGSSSAAMPKIATGTVAGTLTITLTVEGTVIDSQKIQLPASAPTIKAGSVRVVANSSMGFYVELVVSSPTRQVNALTLTFSPASGARLTGNTTFTFDVSSPVAQWYASPASQAYGSLFTLSVPFAISGTTNSIGSVNATLTNSMGSSAPVTSAE
jgi:streptogramin lyase